MTKLTVYGPVQDGMFHGWEVVGPNGGVYGFFFTKHEALQFIKRNR